MPEQRQCPSLKVQLGSLNLQNPVITASGTFGYGEEFRDFVDFSRLGGLVTKGVSLEERAGNPPPRIVETAAGMLNAIGLQNVGYERFAREKMPFLRQAREQGCAIIVNVYGSRLEDYVELARRFDALDGIDAIELNVSCPNVSEGGVVFGKDPEVLRRLVRAVRPATTKDLWVKLTPDVADITLFARIAQEEGAEAVSAINTFRGMAVDLDERRPVLTNTFGGLSGPAIKPLALARVFEIAQAPDLSIPVVGVGGIMDGPDALEFMLCGARAVQVGTANFVDPSAGSRITTEIETWLSEHGLSDINDLVGKIKRPN